MPDNKGAVTNIFQRIHPLTRMVIAGTFALIVFFLLKKEESSYLILSICAWCVFSLTYLVISWIIIFSRSIIDIK
jgi:hypothetical protein